MILVVETVKLAALGKRHISVDRITNQASNADRTEPIILWLQPHTSVHSLRITHTRKTRNCPGRHNQHLGDEVSTKSACKSNRFVNAGKWTTQEMNDVGKYLEKKNDSTLVSSLQQLHIFSFDLQTNLSLHQPISLPLHHLPISPPLYHHTKWQVN